MRCSVCNKIYGDELVICPFCVASKNIILDPAVTLERISTLEFLVGELELRVERLEASK